MEPLLQMKPWVSKRHQKHEFEPLRSRQNIKNQNLKWGQNDSQNDTKTKDFKFSKKNQNNANAHILRDLFDMSTYTGALKHRN